MDREFQRDIDGFYSAVKIFKPERVISQVEKMISDYIQRCNSLDPSVDYQLFKKVVDREYYQKRIDFLKNWLLENGHKYDTRKKKVVPISIEEKKRNILRVAFFNYRNSFVRDLKDIKNPDVRKYESVFRQIREHKLFGSDAPKVDYNLLSEELGRVLGYETPKEYFTPTEYPTFDSWFLRELTEETLKECKKTSMLSDVCSPVQGMVRKKVMSGEMTLKKSVIKADRLLGLIGSDELIQISLKKTDYHHVHSPVDGVVLDVISYRAGELFEGSEALWLVKIQTSFGVVKVMCIGEWTVQTFISEIEVGQEISKLDKLGYFYFGSQVIVFLPKGLEITVSRDREPRLFLGDPLAVL